MLAAVVGQDLDTDADGVFRIATRVAKDRMISTVDPDARHGRKTSARGFDGYKGHVAVDPDSELITAMTVTAGNAGEGQALAALLAHELLGGEDPSGEDEPSWDSLWGPGRPGWHVECSALALRELGTTVDLHGGGTDLIYPHHECERAQSEGATGEPFVRHWMHVGMVSLGGIKMSKSLGNLVFVSDLLKEWEPPAARLAILAHHYRAGFDWNDDLMVTATDRLDRWRGAGPGEQRTLRVHPRQRHSANHELRGETRISRLGHRRQAHLHHKLRHYPRSGLVASP